MFELVKEKWKKKKNEVHSECLVAKKIRVKKKNKLIKLRLEMIFLTSSDTNLFKNKRKL